MCQCSGGGHQSKIPECEFQNSAKAERHTFCYRFAVCRKPEILSERRMEMDGDTRARLQHDRDLLQEPPTVISSDLAHDPVAHSAPAVSAGAPAIQPLGTKPKPPSQKAPTLPARPTNAAASLAAREPLPLLRERASWDRDASNPTNESLVVQQQQQQQRPMRPDIFVNPYPDAGSCVCKSLTVPLCFLCFYFLLLIFSLKK
jgi:hypothetical protein